MKKLLNVVLKDNLLGCPFAPSIKNGLFGWIPGIGDALDDVANMALDTVFGTNFTANETNKGIADANREATKEANQQNIALQRETNAQNYQMFKEQNAFNLDMWNRQNEYNDPKAVVQRMLAAGVNPAGAFGQSAQAGSIGSATPSPAVSPKVIPEVQDWSALPSGANMSNVTAFFQNQLLNKQVESVGLDNQAKQIDNQFKSFEKMANLLEQKARIQESLSRKNLNDEERIKLTAEIEQIDWTLSLFKDTYNEQKKSAKMNNDVMAAQKENYDSQTAINKMEELWRPRLYASNIRLNSSQSAAALGAAAQAWEIAKTTFEERHVLLPLRKIEQILTNGFIATEFNGTVSYEDFIKDNKFQDARSAIRLLGEVLHALQARLK